MLPASLLVLTAAAVWMYVDRRQRLDAEAEAEAADARLRPLDERRGSLRKNPRPAPAAGSPTKVRALRVMLARFDPEDPVRARTEIFLSRQVSWPLPTGWKGRARETAARIEAYDRAFQGLEEALVKERDRRNAAGAPLAPRLRVEDGVPREDVLQSYALLVQLGLEPVSVEGAEPLSDEEKAAQRR